ncbi:MAG TPA: Ig-like domain-containing protein [Thermoanaerobaculia bacterium]|jgi:hypothetical protein
MRLPLVLVSLILAATVNAATLEVEGVQDSLAGPPTINHCTLRKAIINANLNGMASPYPQCLAGSPGVDNITFLVPGTVTFAIAGILEEDAATGDLDIKDDLVITGHPDGTIIDGADLDRIFHVHPGVSLTLNDLTIRNGRGLGWGGGIYVNGGTLTLNHVTITDSLADEGDGGAVYAENASVFINSSTISGNTAELIGGGIVFSSGANGAITSSTITNNASGFSNLTGGVYQSGVSCTLRNTIIAGNGGTDNPNLAGAFTSLGYNIIGSYGTNPAAVTITPAVGDQVNVSDASVLLGALASNGGPTQTHELLVGSIALDKGHASGATTDQRGLPRPCDDGSLANATGGDGGDVGAFERQVSCVTGNPPTAVDDAANVDQDSGFNAIDVLANDSDPDGDALTITAVTQGANGAVTFTATSVSYAPAAGFTGVDSFTYTIDDGSGGTDTATVTVTVNDTEPPSITASVAKSLLWPPNGKLVNVGLTFNATDNNPGVTTSFEVFSDEPGVADDAVGSLLLRAERDGTGDGRVYRIVITATDASDNTSMSCVTVVVPKSMSAADIASVNAQAAAACF